MISAHCVKTVLVSLALTTPTFMAEVDSLKLTMNHEGPTMKREDKNRCVSDAWVYTYGNTVGLKEYSSRDNFSKIQEEKGITFNGWYHDSLGKKSSKGVAVDLNLPKDYVAQLNDLKKFFSDLSGIGKNKSLYQSWASKFAWREQVKADLSFSETIYSIDSLTSHFENKKFLNYSNSDHSESINLFFRLGEKDRIDYMTARNKEAFDLGLNIIEAFTKDIGVESESVFDRQEKQKLINEYYLATTETDPVICENRFRTRFRVMFDKQENQGKTMVVIGFHILRSDGKVGKLLEHAFVIADSVPLSQILDQEYAQP